MNPPSKSPAWEFTTPLWKWEGNAAWHFVTLPFDVTDEIDEITTGRTNGFGSVRVKVTVGRSKWATSVFPDKGRESFLSQNPSIDWDTDNIKACLVRSYTPSQSHQYLSDVTGGGGGTIVASANLGTKSVTGGVADAADITFTAVASGAACNHIVLYKDTGTASTSPLIGYIDTATGLPVTPNGGDINIAWANTADKIFKL